MILDFPNLVGLRAQVLMVKMGGDVGKHETTICWQQFNFFYTCAHAVMSKVCNTL